MTFELKPQPGPQEAFFNCGSDLLFYGGAAGGGKSWALVSEPLRWVHLKGFRGVLLRRKRTELTQPDGLWQLSHELYPHFGGVPNEQKLRWTFPSRATIDFMGCQHEKDKEAFKGAGFCYIGFDEVTDFTESIFRFICTRNRSVCGVNPYVRATCNPDCDSFVRDILIQHWVDPESGYAIDGHSGDERWFIQDEGRVVVGQSREDLAARFPDKTPSSICFIPSKLTDNAILMDRNPKYYEDLKGMPRLLRERFLGGNWNVREKAGGMFDAEWFQIMAHAPAHFDALCRFWDRAGTAFGDFTAGVLIGRRGDKYWVLDVVKGQWTPEQRDACMLETARSDFDRFDGAVELWIEEEGGASGQDVKAHYARLFAPYGPQFQKPTNSKIVRARPFSAQAEQRNVFVLEATWNRDYLNELIAFPTKGVHDDQVDASSGAFNVVVDAIEAMDVKASQDSGVLTAEMMIQDWARSAETPGLISVGYESLDLPVACVNPISHYGMSIWQ